MQLKVFVGLILLAIAAKYIPTVADLLYDEMKLMANEVIKAMSP